MEHLFDKVGSVLYFIIADGLVVVLALVGTYALLRFIPNKEKYQAYARILMAGLTAYLMAKIISLLYQPAELRPFELMGVNPRASFLNNPGFPSDHALFAMAITLAVFFETGRKKLAAVCLAMTLLICTGRVLALVHTPLDVIGGVTIALAGAFWYAKPTKHNQ